MHVVLTLTLTPATLTKSIHSTLNQLICAGSEKFLSYLTNTDLGVYTPALTSKHKRPLLVQEPDDDEDESGDGNA